MSSLRLRPMQASDGKVLSSWAVDPVFCQHAGWRLRSSADEAVPWWEASINAPDPLLLRLLALDGEEPVGYVDLYGDGVDVRELGFVVGPSSRWGRGLGTAVAKAGLAYGFEILGLSRIWAEALEANGASLRILRMIGMSEIGVGDQDVFLGTPSRYVQCCVSRDEWLAHSQLWADASRRTKRLGPSPDASWGKPI